ncbi:hypothetical protein [Marinifilum sp.]|uniref:hypothetical protein n=1 Tax=Marinifilum sp. TaxID=2033137 RepID=UPI003BAB4B5A
MEKFGAYKILQEMRLVVEYYHGVIKLEDIIGLRNRIKEEENFKAYSNTILDFRDCILDIEHDELPEMIAYLKSNSIINMDRKVAFLASTPNEVVLSMLYQQLLIESGIVYATKIFSTCKAATGFFDFERFGEDELIDIIQNLKSLHRTANANSYAKFDNKNIASPDSQLVLMEHRIFNIASPDFQSGLMEHRIFNPKDRNL